MSAPRSLALVCLALAGAGAAWRLGSPAPPAPLSNVTHVGLVAPPSISPALPPAAPPGEAVSSAPAAAPASVAPLASASAPSPCAIERAPAPTDPLDPLFHVSRWHAIPEDYPTPGLPLWTPCNASRPAASWPGMDLICTPRKAGLYSSEGLRQLAWDSPAPADRPTTHDGLPVGRRGRVGFGPMIDEAASLGHELKMRSAFRPRGSQAAVFQSWVNERLRRGLSPADAERHANASSARPGHSEHQLGTTADLVHRDTDGMYYEGWDSARIADSAPMRWLAANAHRFGLVLSYGRETTAVTQYIWEPWHYRFVGVEAADTLHRCDLPLEAYLRERYGEPEPPVFELPPPGGAPSAAGKSRTTAH